MRETYEVEVKIPIYDQDLIVNKIQQAKGQKLRSEVQSDMYFEHPCRSFSTTDEAVRLRRTYSENTVPSESDIHVELTYKGPKVDNTTKTRLEYTSIVNDGDSIVSILHHTGFTHVATITKHRVFYDVDGISISIDNVNEVGLFVEFELISHNDDDITNARKRIFALISSLGLDPNKTIRESYLELYLQKREG